MILIDGAKVYADVLRVMLDNHLLYGLNEPRLEIDRMILRAIRNVEPVDAVKVVRCKDCKWYEKDFGNDFGVCFHRDWTGGSIGHCVDSNGYCYRGERK